MGSYEDYDYGTYPAYGFHTDYDEYDPNFVPPCYSAMEGGWLNATSEEVSAYQRYDRFSWLTNGALTCPLVLLGVAGNLYSVILMRRNSKLRGTVALHLSTLAVWDAALLVSVFGYYGLASLFVDAIQPFLAYKYLAWLLHPVITLTMTSSIWMVVLITSERHMAIWTPLSFRTRDTISRARILCALVGLFSLAVNAPTVFELEIIECAERNGTMGTELAPTSLRYTMEYNIVYRILCYFLFITVCPFTAILILTLRMIWLVRKAQKESVELLCGGLNDAGARKRRRSELAVTQMLLGITIKFLLCYSLPTSLNVWETSNFLNGDEPSLTFRYAVDISNLLVILNSATNSLIVIRFHRRKTPVVGEPPRFRPLLHLWWLGKGLFKGPGGSARASKAEVLCARYQPDPCLPASPSRQSFLTFAVGSRRSSASTHRPRSANSDASMAASRAASQRRRRSRYPSDGRGQGHFSAQEAALLRASWPLMSERGLALAVVRACNAEVPEEQQLLEAESEDDARDSVEALLKRACQRSVSQEASGVEGLLGDLVEAAGDVELETGMGEVLRQLGPLHAAAGHKFTTAQWRELKRAVGEAAAALGPVGDAPQDAVSDAWNRLACFLIARVKQGLQRQPQTHAV